MNKKDKAYINNIREQLIEITKGGRNEAGRISDSAISRGTGISIATVNMFKNDKYTGDNLGIAKKISSWIQRMAEKADHKELFLQTVETFAIRKVCQACRIAHIEGEIVVITGDAGVGKSRGVETYLAENPDVIRVKVVPCYNAKDVMRDIHRAAGFDGNGRTVDMFKDVVEKLRGSGRMLLIDEAELLPYKALELIRRLYDIARIGVAMVGMPRLIVNLRGNKGEYKQLYSRVAVHAEIPAMKERPEDVEALVKSVLPTSNGVWKEFMKVTVNARQLEKLVKRSIHIAEKNECDIDADVIQAARQLIII